MTQYQMGTLVMDYLQSLKVSWINIGEAIQDGYLERSYQLIQQNPKIGKKEFLKKMEIEEKED